MSVRQAGRVLGRTPQEVRSLTRRQMLRACRPNGREPYLESVDVRGLLDAQEVMRALSLLEAGELLDPEEGRILRWRAVALHPAACVLGRRPDTLRRWFRQRRIKGKRLGRVLYLYALEVHRELMGRLAAGMPPPTWLTFSSAARLAGEVSAPRPAEGLASPPENQPVFLSVQGGAA